MVYNKKKLILQYITVTALKIPLIFALYNLKYDIHLYMYIYKSESKWDY